MELAGGEPPLADPEYVECFVLAIDNILEAHNIFKRIEKGETGESFKKSKNMGLKARKISAKYFRRRVSIAEHVLFGIYTTHELLLRLQCNRPLPKRRINWKSTLFEWNKKRPSDIMSSTNVFRTTFYRILREHNVMKQLLEKVYRRQAKLVGEYLNRSHFPMLDNETRESLDKEAKLVFDYINGTYNPKHPKRMLTEGMARRVVYSIFLFTSFDYETDSLLEPSTTPDRLSIMHEFIKSI